MFNIMDIAFVFSRVPNVTHTSVWNEDEIIPKDEVLLDFGPIGSGRPRKDSGIESDEKWDWGAIGGPVIKREITPPQDKPLITACVPDTLEIAAPQPLRAISPLEVLEALPTTSTVPEVVAPPDWSNASVWQQHLEMLKRQEEHDAIVKGRPERRLNHKTGVFINEPAKQKGRKSYGSDKQSKAAQQHWEQQYTSATTAAPGLVADAENLTRLQQSLRADAAEFVPSWAV